MNSAAFGGSGGAESQLWYSGRVGRSLSFRYSGRAESRYARVGSPQTAIVTARVLRVFRVCVRRGRGQKAHHHPVKFLYIKVDLHLDGLEI